VLAGCIFANQETQICAMTDSLARELQHLHRAAEKTARRLASLQQQLTEAQARNLQLEYLVETRDTTLAELRTKLALWEAQAAETATNLTDNPSLENPNLTFEGAIAQNARTALRSKIDELLADIDASLKLLNE
jgi:predicted  nucleic acid-binding Zn-ribbon protein